MQTVPMITLRKGILPSHLMLLLLCFLIDGKIYYYIISFRYLCCCWFLFHLERYLVPCPLNESVAVATWL